MTERHLGFNPGRDGGEPTAGDLAASDAFVEALSRGEDPTGGSDPLAAALLSLRAQTHAPGRGAPRFDDIAQAANPRREQFPAVNAAATASLQGTATTLPQRSTTTPATVSVITGGAGVSPAATGDATGDGSTSGGATSGGAAAGDGDAQPVNELAQRRARRRVSGGGWLGHGLIGAAAATLVIAGSGAAIHAAQPGDALWGIHEAVFSDHAAVVKLASTLEQADTANANGDVQGALELLEKARAMAQDMNRQQPHRVQQAPPVTQSVTVTAVSQAPTTVTVTPQEQQAPAKTTVTPEPAPAPTTTHTVVVTVTSTHVTQAPVPSAVNLAPGVRPTTRSVKLSELMPTTTAGEPTTQSQHPQSHPTGSTHVSTTPAAGDK